ncbi:lipase family protein [Gordonia sp. C13]|uniref:lipase family protein n=1 Tax=Gordonia sp. C13 TaxID=2935078 RepID=UPI00200B6A34|nr:lipase family protein [Gordonia sp. C13]MCK8613515.1 lipase family protein [Gordonia sp. C13]
MRLMLRFLVTLTSVIGLGVSLCLVAQPATAAPVPNPVAAPGQLPSQDPFYVPPRGYENRAPGAILRTRQVQLGWRGGDVPIFATQILYRSTNNFGNPTSTVTTVISPPGVGPGAPRRLVSYHSFYDALGSQCDPSYTLRGGNMSERPIDISLIAGLMAAGYTVSVPDYEGRGLRWTIARESGYAALDGLRATLRQLRAPARTPIGLFGYSGGSVPTGFGAELAPKYAPELNIIGAAAGGVVVDPIHNLGYVNGKQDWTGVIPALMAVYNETYGLNLPDYLSPKGTRILRQVAGQCIEQFADAYPGLTDRQLLKPGVGGILDVPGARRALSKNVMGTLGTPRSPMMLGVGNSDGVGDGVMITADVARLAGSFCRRGVPTTFTEYRGLSHTAAFIPWSVEALAFLDNRFAGRPTGGC